MRRTVALAGLWVVVAAVAVTVAWQGVSVVGDQVTDERPAPLAAGEIDQRLAESAATSTSSTTGGSIDASTTTTVSSLPGDTTTTTRAPSTPSSTPTDPPPQPPPSSTTTAPAGETRTYNLEGGTAALRFSPSGVTVVFANPAPGFSVEVEPEHGNGVKVEFESDGHESRVDGWWDNGPQDRTREQPKD